MFGARPTKNHATTKAWALGMTVATRPRTESATEMATMASRRPRASLRAPAPKVPTAKPDSRQKRAAAENSFTLLIISCFVLYL